MNHGTKLGAQPGGDATVSRRSAILSSVFRSGVSMRSFANLQMSNLPRPHPNLDTSLTAAQKEEVFSRDLKVEDPQAPKSLVRFKFSTNTFEDVSQPDGIIVHCEMGGRIAPVNPMKIEQEETAGEEEEEGAEKEEGVLRNQFNFSDRATQGRILVHIDQGTLTEAPKPKDCTGSTTQREIAALYAKDRKSSMLPPPHTASEVTRIMERVVNQNMDPNACCDFKFFDDQRDTLTREAAYTLPLWEFKSEQLAGLAAYCIRWNPEVADMFAVAYAPSPNSKDTGKEQGFVCTWSLKNQSTPRNVIDCGAPALSLDWNRTNSSLIAIGTADGNVAVFDVRKNSGTPLYSTHKCPDRHASGVAVVRWQPLDNSGNNTLLSAGLDGRILLWTMIQNEMKVTEIAQLPAGIVGLDYFNEQATHFTVACDDGRMYTVLRTRTTQPPRVLDAHTPPILGLAFNRFHPEVYASSGTDWSLKLWRQGDEKPLQVYDFAPYYVTDIQFSPISSTIIAAVTSDGELFIYDINVHRYQELCKTEIMEQGDGGLTSVRFHHKWPIILVGDDKGRVEALKLSPNLRRNTKTDKEEEERNKMVKASSSRDSRGLLPDLTQPQDDDEEGGNAAAEEEARMEALGKDETAKFEKCMGVSWVVRPPHVSALPSA